MFYLEEWLCNASPIRSSMTELSTPEECDALLSHDLAILFKHSPSCPMSWMAHREVTKFQTAQPDIPVFLISVRKRRDLARLIAERTGIHHESPQIIVIRDGRVAGSASHDGVTAEFLTAFS